MYKKLRWKLKKKVMQIRRKLKPERLERRSALCTFTVVLVKTVL